MIDLVEKMRMFRIGEQTKKRKKREAYLRRYYATHRGERKLYLAEPFTKEKNRFYHLLKTYGLTKATYDDLFDRQGGRCAICGWSDWSDQNPAVDHDHASGKVRGLLCTNCNTALGLIKDDPKIAQAMIDYLGRRA